MKFSFCINFKPGHLTGGVVFLCLLLCSGFQSLAQAQLRMDTLSSGNVTIIKDARLNDLVKKELYFNEQLLLAPKNVKGFRLLLLSTSDRNMALQLRSKLLQRFPNQKIYMSYQLPNIKLKFGNFQTKEEAEDFKDQIIAQKMVAGNIYIVPDMVEIKPDKNNEKTKTGLQ